MKAPISIFDPAVQADRARALELINVSRETLARLDRFVELLFEWQAKTNLVAASELSRIWTRHVADSLQLLPLAPGATIWFDLGSGGGFPAIPVGCALAEGPAAKVHMIESNVKKAAFLREAVRATGAPGLVHQARIEDCGDGFGDKANVVSARALAPLNILCEYAYPFIARGAVGLFLKGQDVGGELTVATKYWNIESEKVPSKTGNGVILVVRRLQRRVRA